MFFYPLMLIYKYNLTKTFYHIKFTIIKNVTYFYYRAVFRYSIYKIYF